MGIYGDINIVIRKFVFPRMIFEAAYRPRIPAGGSGGAVSPPPWGSGKKCFLGTVLCRKSPSWELINNIRDRLWENQSNGFMQRYKRYNKTIGNVSVTLQFNNRVTLLQRCSIVASSLHHRCIIVTSPLPHRCITVSPSLFHRCTPLHHRCIIVAPSLLHRCTPLLHRCIIVASSLHHRCFIVAPSLLHRCIIVASSLHQRCIIVPPSLHHRCSVIIVVQSLHHLCSIIATSLFHHCIVVAASLFHCCTAASR